MEDEKSCGHPDAWFWSYRSNTRDVGRYRCFQCVNEMVQELPLYSEVVISRMVDEDGEV